MRFLSPWQQGPPVGGVHPAVRKGTVKRGDGAAADCLQSLGVAGLDQEVESDAAR